MSDAPLVSEAVAAIVPPLPGKPIEEVTREYGVPNPVKLASNENPLGPSPAVAQAITEAMGTLHQYPDGAQYNLKRVLAQKYGMDPSDIALGNGSNELISLLIQAFVASSLLSRSSRSTCRTARASVSTLPVKNFVRQVFTASRCSCFERISTMLRKEHGSLNSRALTGARVGVVTTCMCSSEGGIRDEGG